jgi:hypothetical protein
LVSKTTGYADSLCMPDTEAQRLKYIQPNVIS